MREREREKGRERERERGREREREHLPFIFFLSFYFWCFFFLSLFLRHVPFVHIPPSCTILFSFSFPRQPLFPPSHFPPSSLVRSFTNTFLPPHPFLFHHSSSFSSSPFPTYPISVIFSFSPSFLSLDLPPLIFRLFLFSLPLFLSLLLLLLRNLSSSIPHNTSSAQQQGIGNDLS